MGHEMAARPASSLMPEHDWAAAARVIHPVLRPLGTIGVDGRGAMAPSRGGPGKPLVTAGPAGLSIMYVIPAEGFGVLVGVEHLLAWGVGPDDVHAAAMSNLSVWSKRAGWTAEVEGRRRVVWSDGGEGMDCARILLSEVHQQLMASLAPAPRIMVGMPERDLLIAAGLSEGDDEFASMFASYVADRFSGADEPIDGRVFELVDGGLVAIEPAAGR
jgi:hypothetical protein